MTTMDIMQRYCGKHQLYLVTSQEYKHKIKSSKPQQTSWACCSINSCLRFVSTVWVILLFYIPDHVDSLVKTYCASPDWRWQERLSTPASGVPGSVSNWVNTLKNLSSGLCSSKLFKATVVSCQTKSSLFPILCQCWGSPNLPEPSWNGRSPAEAVRAVRRAVHYPPFQKTQEAVMGWLASPGSAAQVWFWWP